MNFENLSAEELISLCKEQASKIETLEKGALEKENECKDHLAENVDLKSQVDNLNKIIAAAGSGEAAKEKDIDSSSCTLEHKNKYYSIRLQSFYLPGDEQPHTAKELLADEALVAKVLAINGQRVLVELA